MAEAGKRRRNGVIWLGLLLTVLGPLSNALEFIGFPAAPLTWISLVLPIIGFVLVVIGLWRALRQPEIYRGKVAGSIIAVVSLLLLVGSIKFFSVARQLPPESAGAPQVGQRVPDFTLPDSDGHLVSLSQLISGSAGSAAPKAVLLVFYRGYW
jgi:hypothetical protein